MKRLFLRLSVALLTLLIGLSLTSFWKFYNFVPDVPNPLAEEKIFGCNYYNYVEHQISKEEKKFWNKEVLGRFKENPLDKLPDSIDESYRFVLIPTFDKPVSIRVQRSGDKKFLVAKKLSGEGGFGIKKFGKLFYEKTRPLTEDEWLTFMKLLDQSWFWYEPSLDCEEPVNDGATWVMEGVKDDKFHEVHRISPNKEFEKACVYLLKLTELESEYEGYWQVMPID